MPSVFLCFIIAYEKIGYRAPFKVITKLNPVLKWNNFGALSIEFPWKSTSNWPKYNYFYKTKTHNLKPNPRHTTLLFFALIAIETIFMMKKMMMKKCFCKYIFPSVGWLPIDEKTGRLSIMDSHWRKTLKLQNRPICMPYSIFMCNLHSN